MSNWALNVKTAVDKWLEETKASQKDAKRQKRRDIRLSETEGSFAETAKKSAAYKAQTEAEQKAKEQALKDLKNRNTKLSALYRDYTSPLMKAEAKEKQIKAALDSSKYKSASRDYVSPVFREEWNNKLKDMQNNWITKFKAASRDYTSPVLRGEAGKANFWENPEFSELIRAPETVLRRQTGDRFDNTQETRMPSGDKMITVEPAPRSVLNLDQTAFYVDTQDEVADLKEEVKDNPNWMIRVGYPSLMGGLNQLSEWFNKGVGERGWIIGGTMEKEGVFQEEKNMSQGQAFVGFLFNAGLATKDSISYGLSAMTRWMVERNLTDISSTPIRGGVDRLSPEMQAEISQNLVEQEKARKIQVETEYLTAANKMTESWGVAKKFWEIFYSADPNEAQTHLYGGSAKVPGQGLEAYQAAKEKESQDRVARQLAAAELEKTLISESDEQYRLGLTLSSDEEKAVAFNKAIDLRKQAIEARRESDPFDAWGAATWAREPEKYEEFLTNSAFVELQLGRPLTVEEIRRMKEKYANVWTEAAFEMVFDVTNLLPVVGAASKILGVTDALELAGTKLTKIANAAGDVLKETRVGKFADRNLNVMKWVQAKSVVSIAGKLSYATNNIFGRMGSAYETMDDFLKDLDNIENVILDMRLNPGMGEEIFAIAKRRGDIPGLSQITYQDAKRMADIPKMEGIDTWSNVLRTAKLEADDVIVEGITKKYGDGAEAKRIIAQRLKDKSLSIYDFSKKVESAFITSHKVHAGSSLTDDTISGTLVKLMRKFGSTLEEAKNNPKWLNPLIAKTKPHGVEWLSGVDEFIEWLGARSPQSIKKAIAVYGADFIEVSLSFARTVRQLWTSVVLSSPRWQITNFIDSAGRDLVYGGNLWDDIVTLVEGTQLHFLEEVGIKPAELGASMSRGVLGFSESVPMRLMYGEGKPQFGLMSYWKYEYDRLKALKNTDVAEYIASKNSTSVAGKLISRMWNGFSTVQPKLAGKLEGVSKAAENLDIGTWVRAFGGGIADQNTAIEFTLRTRMFHRKYFEMLNRLEPAFKSRGMAALTPATRELAEMIWNRSGGNAAKIAALVDSVVGDGGKTVGDKMWTLMLPANWEQSLIDMGMDDPSLRQSLSHSMRVQAEEFVVSTVKRTGRNPNADEVGEFTGNARKALQEAMQEQLSHARQKMDMDFSVNPAREAMEIPDVTDAAGAAPKFYTENQINDALKNIEKKAFKSAGTTAESFKVAISRFGVVREVEGKTIKIGRDAGEVVIEVGKDLGSRPLAEINSEIREAVISTVGAIQKDMINNLRISNFEDTFKLFLKDPAAALKENENAFLMIADVLERDTDVKRLLRATGDMASYDGAYAIYRDADEMRRRMDYLESPSRATMRALMQQLSDKVNAPSLERSMAGLEKSKVTAKFSEFMRNQNLELYDESLKFRDMNQIFGSEYSYFLFTVAPGYKTNTGGARTQAWLVSEHLRAQADIVDANIMKGIQELAETNPAAAKQLMDDAMQNFPEYYLKNHGIEILWDNPATKENILSLKITMDGKTISHGKDDFVTTYIRSTFFGERGTNINPLIKLATDDSWTPVQRLSKAARTAFGLPADESDAWAKIVHNHARRWSKVTGQSADDYYKRFGFQVVNGRFQVNPEGLTRLAESAAIRKVGDEYVFYGTNVQDLPSLVKETSLVFYDDMLEMAKYDLDSKNALMKLNEVLEAETGVPIGKAITDREFVERRLKDARTSLTDKLLKLSPEEQQKWARQSLIDFKTGLESDKAHFIEGGMAPKGWQVIAVDVNNLGVISGVYGEPAGDMILRHVGDVIRESMDEILGERGGRAFRTGGDEIELWIENDDDVQKLMDLVNEKTSQTNVEFIDEQGVIHTQEGFSVSHGKGINENQRELALKADKEYRKSIGQRPEVKGTLPPAIVERRSRKALETGEDIPTLKETPSRKRAGAPDDRRTVEDKIADLPPEQQQKWLRQALVDHISGLESDKAHLIEGGMAPKGWHVVSVDVNGLGAINDKFGHPAGNALLRHVGHSVRDSISEVAESTRAFRTAGGKLELWVENEDDVEKLTKLINSKMKESFTFKDMKGITQTQENYSLSFGVGLSKNQRDFNLKADIANRVAKGERSALKGQMAPAIKTYRGTESLSAAHVQKFSEMFSDYISKGTSPNLQAKKAFEQMKTWLVDEYKAVKGKDVVSINPTVEESLNLMFLQEKVKVQPNFRETAEKIIEEINKKLAVQGQPAITEEVVIRGLLEDRIPASVEEAEATVKTWTQELESKLTVALSPENENNKQKRLRNLISGIKTQPVGSIEWNITVLDAARELQGDFTGYDEIYSLAAKMVSDKYGIPMEEAIRMSPNEVGGKLIDLLPQKPPERVNWISGVFKRAFPRKLEDVPPSEIKQTISRLLAKTQGKYGDQFTIIDEFDEAWAVWKQQRTLSGFPPEAMRDSYTFKTYLLNKIDTEPMDVAAAYERILYDLQHFENAVLNGGVESGFPGIHQFMVSDGMKMFLRNSADNVKNYEIADRALDMLGDFLKEEKYIAPTLSEETITSLLDWKDEAVNAKSELVSLLLDGGEHNGRKIKGAIAQVNEVMLDYTDNSKLDQAIKNIFPFWMFPSRSLPFWAKTLATHPQIIAAYNKLKRISRTQRMQKQMVTSRGEPMPAYEGYINIPGTDVWVNPLAPFSFKYLLNVASDFSQDLRYSLGEDDNDVDPLSWTMQELLEKSPILGFNMAPWSQWAVKEAFQLPDSALPRFPIAPEISLIPRWMVLDMIRKLGLVENGLVNKAVDSAYPEATWHDSLVQKEILQNALQQMQEPGAEKERIIEEARLAISDRSGNPLWDKTYKELTNREAVYSNVSFFTAFYPKEYTDAQADMYALRNEINMMKSAMNNELQSSVFNVPTEAHSAWEKYLEMNNTGEGDLYRMYTMLNWVKNDQGQIVTEPEDRAKWLSIALQEDVRQENYYKAYGEIIERRQKALNSLPIGSSYEVRKAVYDRYFRDLVALRNRKEYQFNYISSLQSNKPVELLMEDIQDEYFSLLLSTRPAWDKEEMDYDAYLQKIATWEAELDSISLTLVGPMKNTTGPIHDISDNLRPQQVIPDSFWQSLTVNTLEQTKQWQLKKDSEIDALNNAWESIYWNEYWDAVGGKTGPEAELAEHDFVQNRPVPSADELYDWIAVTYGTDKFDKKKIFDLVNGTETFTIEDAQLERKGKEYMQMQRVWDYLSWLGPTKNFELMEGLQTQLMQQGARSGSLELWLETGGRAFKDRPEELDLLIKQIEEVWKNNEITPPARREFRIEYVEAQQANEFLENKINAELEKNPEFMKLFEEKYKYQPLDPTIIRNERPVDAIYELQSLYYSDQDTRRHKPWFIKNYPEEYKLLVSYWKTRNAYAKENPMWSKYYKWSPVPEQFRGIENVDYPKNKTTTRPEITPDVITHSTAIKGVAGIPVAISKKMEATMGSILIGDVEAMYREGKPLDPSAVGFLTGLASRHPEWEKSINKILTQNDTLDFGQ